MLATTIANTPNTLTRASETFAVSITDAFKDKTGPQAKLDTCFRPARWSIGALAQHIAAGKAWSTGTYAGPRSYDHWRGSQLVCLDMDRGLSVADALAVPFVAQHAAIVHPSASSTPALRKTRVIFVLDRMITDRQAYKHAVEGIVRACGWTFTGDGATTADSASKVAVQPWYGSTNASEARYHNEDAAAVVVDELPAPVVPALRVIDHSTPPKTAAAGRLEKHARSAIAGVLADALAVPAGTGQRHHAYVKAVNRLGDMRDWPHGQDWRAVAESLGRDMDRDAGEIRRAIDHAAQHAPKAQQLTDRRPAVAVLPIGTDPAPVFDVAALAMFRRAYGLAPVLATCPEAALICALAAAGRLPVPFTAADLAQAATASDRTARRWIEAACAGGWVVENAHPDILAHKKGQLYSAPKCPAYVIDTGAGLERARRGLFEALYALARFPEPAPVDPAAFAAAAAADDATAQHADAVSLVTAERARSAEATALVMRYEDAAQARKLRILARAGMLPDTDPDATPLVLGDVGSVSDLRAAVIASIVAAHHAAAAAAGVEAGVIRHADLAEAAACERRAVGKLLAKTPYIPSPVPTFVEVALDRRTHAAVRKIAAERRGAPVAFVTANGSSLAYGPVIPRDAVGVRLNVGKTMMHRAPASAAAPPTPTPAKTTTTRRRNMAAILQAMEGCMLAGGWRRSRGAYAVWERGGIAFEHTFEGMAAALAVDVAWAQAQAEARRLAEIVF